MSGLEETENDANFDHRCCIPKYAFLGRAVQRIPEDPAIGGWWRVNGSRALTTVAAIESAEPWVLGNSPPARPRKTAEVFMSPNSPPVFPAEPSYAAVVRAGVLVGSILSAIAGYGVLRWADAPPLAVTSPSSH